MNMKMSPGLLLILAGITVAGCITIDLTPSVTKEVIVPANETSTLVLTDIEEWTRFVVLQVHTQRANLSLSSSPAFIISTTKTGSSVGLLTFASSSQGQVTWYLLPDSDGNVTVVIFVQLYNADAPLPGGCNEVFNIENDPSIMLTYTDHWTQVWFQWANLASPENETSPICESDKMMNTLSYEVYVYFLNQRDLSSGQFVSGVEKMLTAQDVTHYGLKAFSVQDDIRSKSRVRLLSQRNQGAVYSVVVTRSDTGQKASYISAVTYACDMAGGNCDGDVTAVEVILALVFMGIGLFLLCSGHRYFKLTQVVFGFTFFCLLVFILLSVPHSARDSVRLAVSLTFGVVGGGLWLVFWCWFAFPILSVYLMGLCAGYLVAAVLFFTPFGNMEWWRNEDNYAVTFSCVLLVFTVLLMAYSKLLSILSCSVVGSFYVLMGPSLFLRSSLQLVFLNSLYHQTERDFMDVQVIAPLNAQDIVLLTAWPVLMLGGLGFQLYREWNEPPFSPPNRRSRSFTHILRQVLTRYDGEEEERHNDEEENDGDDDHRDDERRSLLFGTRPAAYSSVQTANQSAGGSSQGVHRNTGDMKQGGGNTVASSNRVHTVSPGRGLPNEAANQRSNRGDSTSQDRDDSILFNVT